MRKGLFVTSDFSFSHNVFYSYISLVRRTAALCGNGLIQVILYMYRVNTKGLLPNFLWQVLNNEIGKKAGYLNCFNKSSLHPGKECDL